MLIRNTINNKANMQAIEWVHMPPRRVTFLQIQKAIIAANKAPPASKKVAWANVYQLSNQYQRQEDETDAESKPTAVQQR